MCHKMATNKLPLFVKEELNLLEPAWVAGGQRILKSIKSVKQRKIEGKSIEIEAVDIIASCKRVHHLMRSSLGLRRRQILESSPTDASSKCDEIISFRDISRLSFGLSNIFSQQVDNLLGDAEKLLNQMKTCGNIFEVPKKPIKTQNRKRKLTTKEQTKVNKKIRVEETEESLDNYCPTEFTNLLDECLEWNNIKLSTEFTRMCQNTSTMEKNITLSEQIHNENPCPIENEGFGDPTPEDIHFTNNIMNELFPHRSLKRPAQDNPSDILCHKRSRLDTTLEQTVTDDAIFDDSNQMPSDCEILTNQDALREILMSPARQGKLQKKKKKKKRTSKLIIDECIKYRRQTLIEHRVHYRDQFEAKSLTRPKIPKVIQTAKELLSGTKYKQIKHKHLENITTKTKPKMDNEIEYTLRAIFGSDCNENLVKAISQNPLIQSSQESLPPMLSSSNQEEDQEEIIPFTVLHISLSEDINIEVKPNNVNNNIYKKDNQYMDSAFSIMEFLLHIWLQKADKKIDVHEFLEPCQNRNRVAFVFYNFLALIRDKYIEITKKEKSLEMKTILIGSESIRLLEEISHGN